MSSSFKVVLSLKKNWQMNRFVIFFLSLVLFVIHLDLFQHVWRQCYSLGRPLGERWTFLLFYTVLLTIFSFGFNAYRLGRLRPVELAYSQGIALFFVNFITYWELCLFQGRLVPVRAIIGLLGVQIIFIVIWSVAAGWLYRKLFPPLKMLIIYNGAFCKKEKLVEKIRQHPEHFLIVGTLDCRQPEEVLFRELERQEAVMLYDLPVSQYDLLLPFCLARSICVYLTPTVSDILLQSSEEVFSSGPLIRCIKNQGLTAGQRFAKRMLDLTASFFCLIIASPCMAVIALAIKCYDGGPVFFRQKRCTINGKIFSIIKFRSMVVDAEKDGIFQPQNNTDPRITPIGRFLRKTHLDELPQLFHILAGTMSFVGPRPERIEHVQEYTKHLPEFAFRLKVKGGLTGYAQVMGAYNTSAYDKLKLDLIYIQNYSLFLDLKLILLTIKGILFHPGSDEQTPFLE